MLRTRYKRADKLEKDTKYLIKVNNKFYTLYFRNWFIDYNNFNEYILNFSSSLEYDAVHRNFSAVDVSIIAQVLEYEFVLASQGIEIYRTRNEAEAFYMMVKNNLEYYDYKQKCLDEHEMPADNEIELFIEYEDGFILSLE